MVAYRDSISNTPHHTAHTLINGLVQKTVPSVPNAYPLESHDFPSECQHIVGCFLHLAHNTTGMLLMQR